MLKQVIVAAAVAVCASPASAHVTLETQETPVSSGYKAVFRVPHGCKGAATTAVRIKIPEGVIGVKPMPKAGWELKIVKGKYAKAYDLYHGSVSEGAREISWSGGMLPDEFYDEFVLQAYLSTDLKPNTVIYFPVVQECAGGATSRWIEIPADGKKAGDYESPAPGLRLLPKK